LLLSQEQIDAILVKNKIGDAIKYTWLHSEDKKAFNLLLGRWLNAFLSWELPFRKT
jgi:hypothetical protein